MSDFPRYRLDDLRRFGAALLAASGVAPARASAMTTHLLWFDAAGAALFGIGTLPQWLERIAARDVDPVAEGKVVLERLGTAVFDGQAGLPSLILARAGELAVEKARDAGVGLVRVENVLAPFPGAGLAAEMATGPVVAVVQGPGPSWSLALPSGDGLPAVYDSALAGPAPRSRRSARATKAPPPVAPSGVPWVSALVPEGNWLVEAASVPALESPASFYERVSAAMKGRDERSGPFDPVRWDARRREVREHGVGVDEATWETLKTWADRLGVDPPAPANREPGSN